MPTRVILVRHGQSTYNNQKRYQGCSDESVLTEKGCLTAYQTGIALSSTSISTIYASPLQRTQQTAHEMIAAMSAVNYSAPVLQTHSNLKEVDLPAWQGLQFQYVREHFAEDYRCWKERPHEFCMTVAQSEERIAQNRSATALPTSNSFFPVQNLYEKAQQFWDEILPQHDDETIVIVSHGGTIRALIATAIDMHPSNFHTLQQSNCGISVLNFSDRHAAQLEFLNLTHHLGEVLPKLKEGKFGLRLLLVPAEESSLLHELADRFASLTINLCLTGTSQNAQRIANLLLNRKIPTIHISTFRPNFLEIWHQAIYCQAPNALCTGLVIVEKDKTADILHQALNLSNQASLHLEPGTVSVLFYPTSLNVPVIQALNLSNQGITA
jgi:phosphoserine phosphatase